MLKGGARQCIKMLALGMESNIMVNNTGMSWQRVYLPLKLYLVDVDDQVTV
jgi:hypothetical protein